MSSESAPLIGFVTCADLSRYFPSAAEPLLTHDDLVAAEALRARGYRVEPVVWGTPVARLAGRFALLVVRSPWDYMDSAANRAAFVGWLGALEAAGLAVQNPLPLVRWNLDKHYLRELADQGVAVVPSRFVDAGQPADLLALSRELRSEAIVVKPCISAAAHDTFLLAGERQVSAFDFDRLRRGRDFIVQPFIDAVREAGEWSVVFIDGQPVHAVLKRPPAGGWLVQDELGGSVVSGEPPGPVAVLAHHAAARIRPSPLYARVDVIDADEPLVSEIELVEPELFFLARTLDGEPRPALPVIEAFCAAIERRLAAAVAQ